jgi:hypothetical protein
MPVAVPAAGNAAVVAVTMANSNSLTLCSQPVHGDDGRDQHIKKTSAW